MEWKYVLIGVLIGAVAGYVRVNKAKTPQTPTMFH